MELTAGNRLGPYEIVTRLGAGGMGEVYKARDTRLDRSVAVKVLPSDLAHNVQLRLRFEREAKAISQLSHPNICTLFDVGDGYLVMELLEGETLADRIARGPLPMADVLRYGAEIATALDRAHRAGIVHRDLKPGNVMLTKSGSKLLDFGLAKAAAVTIGADDVTMQQRAALTQEGTILGTFQYMSPEQLEGIETDPRADIFALGALLYEMATGRRAFEGRTKTSVIAAIVSGQPPAISSLQPVTPPAFEHVVQKCLEKDRDARWQSAHDIADELRWIATTSAEMERAKPRMRPMLLAAMLVLALVAIASTALYLRARGNARTERVALSIRPPRSSPRGLAALSPDGRMIVMRLSEDGAANGFLWVRGLGDFEAKKLVATKEEAVQFWSPDSKWIAFFDGGKLMRIAATGGDPEMICHVNGPGAGGAWSADGTILFAPAFGDALMRVPATGGEPVPVTKLDPKRRESLHGWPQFLPNGEQFLFIVHTVAANKNEIHIGSLDGTHKLLLHADALVGVARSSLVFVRDGSMYAQPLDTKKGALTGSPIRIAADVHYFEPVAHSFASVASDGAVLFTPASTAAPRMSVAWHDRSGRSVQRVLEGTGIGHLRLSRDGSKLVLTQHESKKGASDVFSFDLERAVLTRVTGGLAEHDTPVWSASGDKVYFASDRDGMFDIYAQSEDGTTPAEVVWRSDRDKTIGDVSPDGTMMVVQLYAPESQGDLWLLPLGGGTPRALIASDADETAARLSPDGKWLAYTSDRSGQEEVYVRKFPDGRSIQVSTSGGLTPRWSRDGSALFFDSLGDRMKHSVAVRVEGDMLRVAKSQPIFANDPAPHAADISPIDDRFLFASVEQQETVFNYVSAW